MQNLGKKAEDIITGFAGMITDKSIYLNGTIRYGITPMTTVDGKPAETWNFDTIQVKVISDEPVITPVIKIESFESAPFSEEELKKFLGAKAKDIITGYTGIATAMVIYLNGCVHYAIESECKENKLESAQWFDIKRIEFEEQKEKKYEVSETGGPQRSNPPRM